MFFSLKTEYPVALDSPDHIHPWGVKNDCTTSDGFFIDIENYFKRTVFFLDFGCAGGGLLNQAIDRGHNACALEGSDYWIREENDNQSKQSKIWKKYLNTNIFTCDISRQFEIYDQYNLENNIQFDIISSWECLEHIHPDRLPILFDNIKKHLKPEGYFVGSVSMNNDATPGIELHQSIFSAQTWCDMFTDNGFKVEENNKFSRARQEANSLHILLQKQ